MLPSGSNHLPDDDNDRNYANREYDYKPFANARKNYQARQKLHHKEAEKSVRRRLSKFFDSQLREHRPIAPI